MRVKRHNISIFKIIAVLFLAGFFLCGAISFEKKDVLAAESDAIGVRVMANPHHFGPLAWYQDQGFKGNPTPLTVDGYEAVRDGRTVFVNVANVDLATNKYYTNIYLISYNQSATPETVAIFNNLIGKWKFNTNLTNTGFCFGRTEDTATCAADKDCAAGFSCLAGVCSQVCLSESDCPGGFCSSLKGKVVRDTKRLSDIMGLRKRASDYAGKTGHYPQLGAGTYILGKSISAWPSWSGELTAELGGAVPADPINKLGACGGAQFDPATCWNDKAKIFSGTIPNILPANSHVYAYSTDDKGKSFTACAVMESGFLTLDGDGACPSSFSTIPAPEIKCGNLIGVAGQPFSGYISVNSQDKAPLLLSVQNLPPTFSLNPPNSNPLCQSYYTKIIAAIEKTRKALDETILQITGSDWSAGPCYSYYPYDSALCATAKSHDMSVFGLTPADLGGASFVFDENEGDNAWPACSVPDAVILNNCAGMIDCGNASLDCGFASIPFYKCFGNINSLTVAPGANVPVYSALAPTGNYPITVTATDDNGGISSQTCNINISSNASLIYPVKDQKIIIGKSLSFSVYASSYLKNYNGISFSFTGSPALPSAMFCSAISIPTDGRAKCDVNYSLAQTYGGDITVTANNSAGEIFTPQNFKLSVNNDPPVMQPIKCAATVRVGTPYSCTVTAIDPNGDSIHYNVSSTKLVPGVSIALNGVYSGTPTAAGTYSLDFNAIDQYGATSKPVTFKLQVNDFCGDGVKQSPNMEGKSGQNNTGYEDCDCGSYLNPDSSINYIACALANCDNNGFNGVCQPYASTITGVPAPAQANATWQYGCTKNCASQNGGFCGDGIVQAKYGEQCDDGNNVDGDGCNTFSAHCQHVCGDRSVDTPNGAGLTEQCDFGKNVDCCPISGGGQCQWTTGPDINVPLTGLNASLASGQTKAVSLPPNRGVASVQFNSAANFTDYSSIAGMAVDIIADQSQLPNSQTLVNIMNAVSSAVDSFYIFSNTQNVNVAMAESGFGHDCNQRLCDFGFMSSLLGSQANRDYLKDMISYYDKAQAMSTPFCLVAGVNNPPGCTGSLQHASGDGDYPDSPVIATDPGYWASNDRSFLDVAIDNAVFNLKDPALNGYKKYLIILSDGCTCGVNNYVTSVATAAKALGIKIYAISYGGWGNMCGWSNNNGSNCTGNGPYFFASNGSGTQIQSIINNNIIPDILTDVDLNYKVTAYQSPANFTVKTGTVTSGTVITFNPLIPCQIQADGSCAPNQFNLLVNFNGNGTVDLSNISLNLLDVCHP